MSYDNFTYSLEQLEKLNLPQVEPQRWTAIIPAAGIGSRLGYDKAKILYPVLNRPIVDWLLDRLVDRVQKFIFVLSPTGMQEVSDHLVQRLGKRASYVEQSVPLGMADAIWQAVPNVLSDLCLIVWGDQVMLQSETIDACMRLHQWRTGVQLTLASVELANPYIHLQRDGKGRLEQVLEAREGCQMPERGDNDCGLFLFNTIKLHEILHRARQEKLGLGRQTGECNLLPLLPLFDDGRGSVQTLRIDDVTQSRGINTVADVTFAEAVLQISAELGYLENEAKT